MVKITLYEGVMELDLGVDHLLILCMLLYLRRKQICWNIGLVGSQSSHKSFGTVCTRPVYNIKSGRVGLCISIGRVISDPNRERRETDAQFKVSKQNSTFDLIYPYKITWKAVFDENSMYSLEEYLFYLSKSTQGQKAKKKLFVIDCCRLKNMAP